MNQRKCDTDVGCGGKAYKVLRLNPMHSAARPKTSGRVSIWSRCTSVPLYWHHWSLLQGIHDNRERIRPSGRTEQDMVRCRPLERHPHRIQAS